MLPSLQGIIIWSKIECMNKWILPLTSVVLLSACTAQPQPRTARSTAPAAVATGAVNVQELGRRIWANECSGSVQGLVSWNSGEDFPSLGIGHFIWYPTGYNGPFDESFPDFVAYAQARGVSVPAFFRGAAPWPNKQAFMADKSGKANQMRQWLAANVGLQTEFIIQRSRAALPTMMAHSSNPAAVKAHYNALAATTQGMYCLVDYVNFKGEGIKDTERYKGEGWGLLQVLEEMQGNPQGRAATAEFSRAASAVMRRRVANSPAARNEQKWLPGWLNRCNTYK